MIEVIDITVTAYDLDHLDISWKIRDTNEDLERYSFFLLRSVDGSEGPFQVHAGPFGYTFTFRDPDIRAFHKWRQYFYKIRAVHKDTGDEKEFGAAWLAAPPDLINLEIRRRMGMAQREFNGRPAILLPRLTFGQRCPHCWDMNSAGNSLGKKRRGNCVTCFDTGFVTGYGTPIIFYIQIDPSPVSPQPISVSERQPVDTSSRTSGYPPVSPRDVIIEVENVRWHVERVPSTQKLRAVVHQEPVLHQIPKSDVRYKIPIDLSVLENLKNSREFTRPMSLNYGNDRGQIR